MMISDPRPAITSRRNPRIVDVRKLPQRKHREQQGRFLVEGLQLLLMGLDAGHIPIEAFYCPEMLGSVAAHTFMARLAGLGVDAICVSAEVMAALSDRDSPQGIVATFPLLTESLDALWPVSGLVVVLDRLQDPGNVGTLIRTADAVGADGVVLLEPCVDVHDPKTVRGTMGSLFNLPIVRVANAAALFRRLEDKGVAIVGADVQTGELWGDQVWRQPVALVLGNEARGPSDDVRPHVGAWVRLPMIGKAESLNVAAAGAVLMYTWLRAQADGGRGPGGSGPQ